MRRPGNGHEPARGVAVRPEDGLLVGDRRPAVGAAADDQHRDSPLSQASRERLHIHRPRAEPGGEPHPEEHQVPGPERRDAEQQVRIARHRFRRVPEGAVEDDTRRRLPRLGGGADRRRAPHGDPEEVEAAPRVRFPEEVAGGEHIEPLVESEGAAGAPARPVVPEVRERHHAAAPREPRRPRQQFPAGAEEAVRQDHRAVGSRLPGRPEDPGGDRHPVRGPEEHAAVGEPVVPGSGGQRPILWPGAGVGGEQHPHRHRDQQRHQQHRAEQAQADPEEEPAAPSHRASSGSAPPAPASAAGECPSGSGIAASRPAASTPKTAIARQTKENPAG